MLNRILIKMTIEQLLKDVFELTLMDYSYKIEKRIIGYEITIKASLTEGSRTISKYKKARIDNWVQLMSGYIELKKQLKRIFIDELKEEKQC